MKSSLALPAVLVAAVGLHLVWHEPTEPFFSGDETRHVMTGIFVHDAVRDRGFASPRAYAERFYAQYPCLGLMVWPPGFYAVEGGAMLAFGPTHATARGVMLAYLVVAVLYFHRLVRRTHSPGVALLAAVLLILSREVFINTRAVMLELPTLACLLGAMVHFEAYLRESRRRDLFLFAVWTIAGGLHRYDAVFFAPLFFVWLLLVRQVRVVFRCDVLLAVTAILLALAPFYWLAYQTVGQQHALGATTGTNPEVVRTGIDRVIYYFVRLRFQLSFAVMVFAVLGLFASFRSEARERSRPYWALIAVVYGFFVPFAEQETRHTIYWLPAWCVFAADVALRLERRWLKVLAVVLVVGNSACWTLRQPVKWVRGYSDAAQAVLARTDGPGVVLFDGLFDGTFIYSLRQADADRRLWVARGDKLLYAVKSDPAAAYVEWAATERGMLKVLDALAPDAIVVEDPPVKYTLPAQAQLRRVLAAHPERYERVAAFPIHSNSIEWMEDHRLAVYVSKTRVTGPRKLRIPMLWGGRDLSFDLSK